jgi:hypothetical protein
MKEEVTKIWKPQKKRVRNPGKIKSFLNQIKNIG